jgi:ComF family protein
MKKLCIQAAFGIRFVLYALLTVLLGAEPCVSCGKPCRVLPLCKTCGEKLLNFESSGPRCSRCGKPLISETGLCMKCRPRDDSPAPETAPAVSRCFPVFPYRLWRKELLFLWKGRGVRLFTPLFARILARALDREFRQDSGTLPAIVPVPPRPGKIREKGWDQVEDLASYLEGYYGLTVKRLLKRRSSLQQKKLSQEERAKNARNAFYLAKKAGPALPAQAVLLDDVRTTGATLERAAQVLRDAGVQDVGALVLFATD